MKKVCMLVQEYYPKDFRVRRVAESLIDRGFDVDIIALRDVQEAPFEILNRVRIFRIDLQKKRGTILRYIYEYLLFTLLTFFKCTKLYFKNHYDTVIINNPPDFLVFAAIIPKLFGAKIVIDLHEIVYEDFETRFHLPGKKLFLSLIKFGTSLSLKLGSRLITVNDALKSIYETRINPAHPVTVVMNSVDESRMLKNRCLNGKPFSLMYHGTLSKHYGVDEAIQALPHLVNKRYNFTMHILGDGIEKENLEALAARLNVQNHIQFHGYVSRDKTMEFLNTVNLGIIPTRKSKYTDLSLSNKFMECIYFEVPTIASNINTYRYYFPDDCMTYFQSGDIADLASKIEFAMNEYGTVQEKAHRAYLRYQENYNWQKMMDRYVAAIM
ncbi:glycosyltransferase family 4 protein [candidate division KSB1 bacterium]|nr:glycosyltransferase family 4 protein [candidate division KSB1 bacterium]